MKFSLDNSSGLSIHGYAEGEITLLVPSSHPLYGQHQASDDTPVAAGLTRLCQSFILTANQVFTDWPPQDLQQLEIVHLDPILALQPELVLLGTGATHRFPTPELMVCMNQMGFGVEVMDTRAACRTFNILIAEGRQVAAALMMI